MIKKIVLGVVAFAVGLLIAELIVRTFVEQESAEVILKCDAIGGGGAFFKISDDPVLLYEWITLPQDIAKEKPKNLFRVVALGDSFTYRGSGSLDNFYPKKLEKLLNQESSSLAYEVINAGVPGYNTIQEVRYLKKKLLDYLPDTVILGYCAANDRTIKRKIIRYEDGLYCSDVQENYPYFLDLPEGLNRFLLRHCALYRFLNKTLFVLAKTHKWQKVTHQVKYFNLTQETENALRRLKELSLANNFHVLIVVFPILTGQDHESAWIVERAQQYGLDFIDLRRWFKPIGYEKLRVSQTDLHPNNMSQQVAAQAIYEYLSKHFLLSPGLKQNGGF